MVTGTQNRNMRNSLVDDTPRALIVPGNKDIILEPKDFSSWRCWERLCLGMSLRAEDFVEVDTYKKYFYLANGLTTGLITIGGYEGSGKSLILYKLAYDMRNLFGKRCTFDSAPKETFGEYRLIDDMSFVEELKKFGEVAKMEKLKEKGDVSKEDYEATLNDIKLYNTVIGIDEAYDKLDKSRRGNFAVNMGHFIRKYRHYHNLFLLATPDLDDIDRRMAFKRRTHEIHCSRDMITGVCRYRIWWRRPNTWNAIELTPQRWAFLWETHNVIGGTILSLKKEGNTANE